MQGSCWSGNVDTLNYASLKLDDATFLYQLGESQITSPKILSS